MPTWLCDVRELVKSEEWDAESRDKMDIPRRQTFLLISTAARVVVRYHSLAEWTIPVDCSHSFSSSNQICCCHKNTLPNSDLECEDSRCEFSCIDFCFFLVCMSYLFDLTWRHVALSLPLYVDMLFWLILCLSCFFGRRDLFQTWRMWPVIFFCVICPSLLSACIRFPLTVLVAELYETPFSIRSSMASLDFD